MDKRYHMFQRPFRILALDAEGLRSRLRQPVTHAEFFALCFTVGMLGIFGWYHGGANEMHPLDYGRYLRIVQGDFAIHYYAYWSNPMFHGFAYLPGITGYLLWGVLSIVSVFVSTRLFGGNAAAALLTYQLFYILFYGQIMALLLGGLALCAWGSVHQRWHWAGLGLVIATTKYQTGLSFGLFLWLLAPITWRDRLKMLIVPLIIVGISLLVYPLWPLTSLQTILGNPPDDLGSITLWRWLGPWALLFWLPPMLLPLSPDERLIALSATSAFALPYFQQTDLLFFFILPLFNVGWQLLLGSLGFFLFSWRQWPGLWWLVLIPLLIYGYTVIPPVFTGNLQRRCQRLFQSLNSPKGDNHR